MPVCAFVNVYVCSVQIKMFKHVKDINNWIFYAAILFSHKAEIVPKFGIFYWNNLPLLEIAQKKKSKFNFW